MRYADHVIISRSIFTGDRSGPGFVAVRGERLLAVDTDGGDPGDLIASATTVIDAGDGLVMPGMHDNHTFFTSALLKYGGLQAGGLGDDEVIAQARRIDQVTERGDGAVPNRGQETLAPLIVTGLDSNIGDDVTARVHNLVAKLGRENPHRCVVVIAADRSALGMSESARARYGDVDAASNESLASIYADLGRDAESVRKAFGATAQLMAETGVVSVKDIALDDYLGMFTTIRELLSEPEFPVRLAFAMQPVRGRANLEFGASVATDGGAARFHGFKLMTDGSFDECTADFLPPDDLWRRRQRSDVNYSSVCDEAERILDAGYRLALNADGDGAVRRCIRIFEAHVQAGRKLPHGCSISDVSLLDGSDAEQIAHLGLFVETYPQMLRFDGYTRPFLGELLGPERGPRLANFSAMEAAGVSITAGTDYPLFTPSLPESLLSASERLLPPPTGAVTSAAGCERWHPELGIRREAVMRSWTGTAAKAMGHGGASGRLVAGASADVVVFDSNLLSIPTEELAESRVNLTLRGGRTVYQRTGTRR